MQKRIWKSGNYRLDWCCTVFEFFREIDFTKKFKNIQGFAAALDPDYYSFFRFVKLSWNFREIDFTKKFSLQLPSTIINFFCYFSDSSKFCQNVWPLSWNSSSNFHTIFGWNQASQLCDSHVLFGINFDFQISVDGQKRRNSQLENEIWNGAGKTGVCVQPGLYIYFVVEFAEST